MTCSQTLLTCNPQYFQGRIPFKFLQFLIISRRQGMKMALTSFTSNVTLRFTPLAAGPNFGNSDFIGLLRDQSEMTHNRMSSDPHNGVNSLDLNLMGLRYYTIWAANNKGADQTARMCRLISASVVHIWYKQVFS